MGTLKHSQKLIKLIHKKQGEKAYSALEDDDFDPTQCFVKYPFHHGYGWVDDAMYGAVGGYYDDDEPAFQCERGEDSVNKSAWYYKPQFFSYGEFGICRFHAEMLPEEMKPVDLQNERVAEAHRDIESGAWNDVGWGIDIGVKEDFVGAVRDGERMELSASADDGDKPYYSYPEYVGWGSDE